MKVQQFYLERKKHIQNEITRIQENYEAEKAEIQSAITEFKGNISELNTQLNALGFFKFDEKKAIKSIINSYEAQIEKKNKQLSVLSDDTNDKLKEKKRMLSYIDPKLGAVLELGTEPNSHTGTPLEWKVLEKDENVITLVTKHTVEHTSYYSAKKWLEDEFVKDVFSDNEAALLTAEDSKSLACLPSSAQATKLISQESSPTPTESLKNRIILKAKTDGARFGHNRLQIENSIKFNLDSCCPYWLITETIRDGFASYVGQAVAGGWIISRIGAAAPFGVRVVIKVDKFKMSNFQ